MAIALALVTLGIVLPSVGSEPGRWGLLFGRNATAVVGYVGVAALAVGLIFAGRGRRLGSIGWALLVVFFGIAVRG